MPPSAVRFVHSDKIPDLLSVKITRRCVAMKRPGYSQGPENKLKTIHHQGKLTHEIPVMNLVAAELAYDITVLHSIVNAAFCIRISKTSNNCIAHILSKTTSKTRKNCSDPKYQMVETIFIISNGDCLYVSLIK
jgi:hypothetical protein